MNESRIKKSLLNARVNFIFYFITLFISFFSRKIFLDTLGADFMGLTGTLTNILGMLSLAELGIGTSISFHLYKPIRDNDYVKINELMSLFGWLYRLVGGFILVAAVIVSLFFPFIFDDASIDLPLIYVAYASLLGSSLIGYFINYRQMLLGADQKGYVVAVYLQGASVVKTLVQMYLCSVYLNYYLWIAIEFGFAIIACVILNWKINKTYPWLTCIPSNGRELYKKYPTILQSVKQIFVHRMKDFLLTQSDQILVFAFVSLKYVAYYGNYTLLTLRITALFRSVMGSADAGIGNLIAENNREKSLAVFWELMSMRYWLSVIIVVILYFTIPPFIELWLGSEYLLSNAVFALIMVNVFIAMTRTVVDSFNHCSGLYADVWSAWTEGGINLFVTIVAASQFGLIGILLGKIASLVSIVVLWKPFYLFRDGLREKYLVYWRHVGVYYLLALLTIVSAFAVNRLFPASPTDSWTLFIAYCAYIGSSIFVAHTVLMYFLSHGLKGMFCRLINNYRNR
ncbi:MAG: sugar transporter [Bacteroidales bacterium]|nr:sugar transporter [Bacteroidales bacterium]